MQPRVAFGIPTELADLLAESEAGPETGALFDDSRELSTLIGQPTTPLATSIALALGGAKASEARELAPRAY